MSGMTRRDVSTAQLMKTHGYSARTDYHKDKQDAQAVREIAREILRLTRSTLLIHMRFLESALVRFVPGDETVTPEMATDGKFLYYNSIHICRLFKTSPQLVCRDYLHLTLHCIFLSSRICRRRRSDAYGNISMPTITAYGTDSPKQAPAAIEARAGIRRRTAPTAHPSLVT